MGKKTGFLEYERETSKEIEPKERIKNFNEFHVPLPREKQREQAARCMDCGVPFCQSGMMIGGMASGCPLNNLIPEWNDCVYHGNWEEAFDRLKKTNNFPEFTSRVCPSPCEAACTCNLNGLPVSNKENERSIIESAYKSGLAAPKAPSVRTGKKIAVIGSGPSGLAAADQLNKRGHSVTVYEKSDRVGGLLMYGIPNMKLEKQIIDRKVEVMKAEGVTFVTNANVGATKAAMTPMVAKEDAMGEYLTNPDEKAVKADQILKEYDSVILACGASNPRDIKAKGREADGIYFAVDFLTRSTKHVLTGKKEGWVDTKGKNVIVIGGGDTGNDCVGTAVRQGAKSVTQLEMMPKLPDERAASNPWPEWPRVCKTDYGQEEAIAVFGHDSRIYQTTVKEFVADKNGKLKKVKLVKLEAKKDPKTGRMNMTEIAGSEFEMPADGVLIAAGFLGAQEYVAKAFGVKLNARTNVETAPGEFKTSVDKVFTAGDMHRGQSLVVWGINEGRHVAKEVDQFLMGYTNLD